MEGALESNSHVLDVACSVISSQEDHGVMSSSQFFQQGGGRDVLNGVHDVVPFSKQSDVVFVMYSLQSQRGI